MMAEKQDPTSDEARTNPDTADTAREDLKKQAEEGLRNAARKIPSDKK
jgi:hypothetical protein|nr:hypothetical protein [Neorhizobium tomejilense]